MASAIACTTAPPAPPRSTLAVGIVGEPKSLLIEDERPARFLGALAMEELVRRDDKDELAARLVERVPTFDDGTVRIVADEHAPGGRLVVTFVLRAGLVWHDGRPLTSDDIVFAWERDRAAPRDSRARVEADLVERVRAADPRTAVFVLRPGVRTNRYALLAHVMPRHVLGAATDDIDATYARRPVHAGPFVVASWQDGSGVTFTPFDRYALGKPKLSRIEVRFYGDDDALLVALQKGEVEMAPTDALEADVGPQLERFVESRGMLVRYTPQQWGEFLLFDLRHAFADARLRRAVLATVDRRAISQQVFAGRARVPSSYLFGPSWAALDSAPPPDVDRDAARGILAAAGYCAAARCAGAQTLRARIVVEGGSASRLAAAHLVARDLSGLGLVTTVLVYSPSAFTSALVAGDFDLAITSRGGADPADATDEYISMSAANVTGFADPAFDVLAPAAASFLTRAERRPLYAELQRIWNAALPAIPLYQELAVDVVPASLEGVAPSALHEPLSWNAFAWRHNAP